MADDKSKVGKQDRAKVSKGDGYEVNDFARKHNITRDQAEALIKKHGNDRAKLEAAAKKMRSTI